MILSLARLEKSKAFGCLQFGSVLGDRVNSDLTIDGGCVQRIRVLELARPISADHSMKFEETQLPFTESDHHSSTAGSP